MITFTRWAAGVAAVVFTSQVGAGLKGPAGEPPREWTDPDTGHRVVRLSDEPGSQSLYLHQNGYTPDGTRLAITTPTGFSAINLKTRVVEKVVEGRVNLLMVWD